jgi:phosphatidylethanolamine-binding protein (PEBP) family uncharacterized protein
MQVTHRYRTRQSTPHARCAIEPRRAGDFCFRLSTTLKGFFMRLQTALITTLFCFSTTAFAQSGLSVDWEWKRAHKCSPKSPELAIAGIPNDAKSLHITLVDHDARGFDHGGGVVAHDGETTASIPGGALKNYKGPCPPNFFSRFGHEYEFTVRAIASDGKTELARGSKTKTFSATAVKE